MDKRFSRSTLAMAVSLAMASMLASAPSEGAAQTAAPAQPAQLSQPSQPTRPDPSDAIDAQQREADTRDRAVAPLPAADRRFLEEAVELGAAEVQSAQLALQRSGNERIRDFAEHMVDEHGSSNEQLIRIARDAGVSPPSDTNPQRTHLLDRLNRLSGAEFDRAFIAMQVEMHREALELFERQAREGQHAELRTIADEKVPLLREHLQSAQALQPGQRGGAGTAPAMPTAPPPAGQARGPAEPVAPTTGDADVTGTGTPGTVGATGTLQAAPGAPGTPGTPGAPGTSGSPGTPR
jgi:putative membrane protein